MESLLYHPFRNVAFTYKSIEAGFVYELQKHSLDASLLSVAMSPRPYFGSEACISFSGLVITGVWNGYTVPE